ncbi:MAG: hypothetical protein IJ725_02105 [Ruminococcus sp.]|nr:hypothetical protein [Ruminococcus sp.]
MAYQYRPYTESAYTRQKRQQQDQATQRYNQWANQNYRSGAGGLRGEVNAARDRLNNLYKNNNLSQQFKYSKQSQYDEALNNILNRKAFQYDLSDDQLFQQYKDNYQAMGKAAMADTIGQASAMTGGYGNSYATAAGAQTYNNYLQEINSSIGDFYNMALSGYNTETDRLNSAYSAISGDRATEQNEWQGNWNVYNNLYQMYSNDYNSMLDRDINLYNQHGQNLYNAANLYTNQYGTASGNDTNVWSQGESMRAQQAAQAETARSNRANENISRTKANNSGDSSKSKQVNATNTKNAQKVINLILADRDDYNRRADSYQNAHQSIPNLEELAKKYIKANNLTDEETMYVYYALGLLG